MPEREMHLVEAAVRFVDAVLGLVLGDLRVRIGSKEFRENHLSGIRTSHWEGVTYDRPLRLTIKAEHLSQVMHKAGENEPTRMAILANRFGSLQQVLDLAQVRVRIAFVHQRIQIFRHFPNTLLASDQAAVFGLFLQHKLQGLMGVILAVKLGDGRIGVSSIVAKLALRLSRLIASSYKIVPIIKLLERGSFFAGGRTQSIIHN